MHRSHFGSRYKLGCCGHTSLFTNAFTNAHLAIHPPLPPQIPSRQRQCPQARMHRRPKSSMPKVCYSIRKSREYGYIGPIVLGQWMSVRFRTSSRRSLIVSALDSNPPSARSIPRTTRWIINVSLPSKDISHLELIQIHFLI